MRAYLAEFLSDPMVVQLPRFLWLPILHGVVLNTRPQKSAEKYRLIWSAEGSPLAVHTARQAKLLGADHAMRYGKPDLRSALQRKPDIVIPLYPQYSDSATGSVLAMIPSGVKVVRDFHDHPAYIGALAAGVERHWAAQGRAEKLVMSFHGLPQRTVDRGDPYQSQCLETARLLSEKLNLSNIQFVVTFQSRFGAARWLQPYTEPTLLEMARSGVRRVDVAFPGFVSDCLETLEEIGISGRKKFLQAGGGELCLVPCLNESPEWIEALGLIARAAP